MTGDPYRYCYSVPVYVPSTEEKNPCNPSPCGINSICRSHGSSASCECIQGYSGNPYEYGCKPECTINSDCELSKSCSNYKCVDPCVGGVCGYNAICKAINHAPICSCPQGMVGNPFVSCTPALEERDPCNPSPCSQNGICRNINGKASCTYPECVKNEDCSSSQACFNQRCGNPCIGACGENALCNVVNHKAVCSCPRGYMGSPFLRCSAVRDPLPQPECTSNDNCPLNKACFNEKCVDACALESCGQGANCFAQNHRSTCVCPDGYTGNARFACYEIGCRSHDQCRLHESCINRQCVDSCSNLQCGKSAYCKADNHIGRCHCHDGYYGNPLIECVRPECVKNDDCPNNLYCKNEKCVDPCSCAPSAQCFVRDHRATCQCPPGYTGDPLTSCTPIHYDDRCTSDAMCASKLACFDGKIKQM